MDFLARILSHTPLASGSASKDAARDPFKRRQRFEREYSQLLQIWRSSANLARDVDAAENIEIRLQELTNILADESRRPLPHPCITFSATKQIYVPIAKIATTSYNEWIIKEAVLFFATLIESEEEAFVENDAFSASLTNLLVRITGQNSIRLGSDTEARVVELAFNITTKIRLEPSILPAWFKSNHDETAHEEHIRNTDQREKFAGKTQKQDFPLFYLLMDYIHHDGKVGDFARTGLLYIIESASSSVILEQWIVESDLSTLMATGLGALYSQLSRKLVIDHPPQDVPPVLALSDYQHPPSTLEIISSCNPDFQLHLETFLSHLLFWQDVLNHCRSTEVKSTLLEHFQVIFLQQLLYPSLLESSDVDGGSSVAVLTYLRRILEALDHPDMINLILHYLLALPDSDGPSKSHAEPAVSAARKRKSMDLATMMAQQAASDSTYTPLLFNLVDLIQSCLKSRNLQTVCVTLQLVAAILKRHHRYAIITLLRTEGVIGTNSQRTHGAHAQEVEFFMTMAESIGGQDNFDVIYDTLLRDTMSRLEGHPCSLKLVAPKVSSNNHKLPAIPDSLPGAPRDVPPHTLSPTDPLLNSMFDLLESFFVNPVETNLSLTETLVDLAVCGYVRIEGWLLRHPSKYVYDDDADEPASPVPEPESPSFAEAEQLQAMSRCRQRPQWQTSSLPRVLVILQSLTDQVASFRGSIPRFDDLMQQRREAFQMADSTVPNQPRTRANTATESPGQRQTSPARPGGIEGLAQRLLSELGTPSSRPSAPRGRKESGRSSSATSTGSGGYGMAASTSKPLPTPPKEFPMNPDTPNRSGASRSFSPTNQVASPAQDGAVASQMAAFAAVDQSILARRVGLPPRIIDSVPLNFDKRPSEEPVPTEERSAQGSGHTETDEAKRGESESGEAPEALRESALPDTAETSRRPQTATEQEQKQASVSHIITNVVIFQSFLMELASLVQVRAGLFNEVRFV